MAFTEGLEEMSNNVTLCTIKVIGVGGAGNNAVDHMIDVGVNGVEFWVANTDMQMLSKSSAKNRIILGENITKGLGAGADPEVGKQAALESEQDIKDALEGADMVFIAAGMGGGTGTGAAPIFARIAKELGALTIGVVTKPFTFEGKLRSSHASEGIQELKEHVDSLIIVSNDRLLQMNGAMPFKESFEKADGILGQSVSTITDLISNTGFINRDFADVRTVLYNKGIAMIGFGQAKGENKIAEATNKAICSPLLEASFSGAKNAIVNVCGSKDLSLLDIYDVSEIINEASGNDINIILGAEYDDSLEDEVRVSVIATDFDETKIKEIDVRSLRPRKMPEAEEKAVQGTLDLPSEEENKVVEENDDEGFIPDFLRKK